MSSFLQRLNIFSQNFSTNLSNQIKNDKYLVDCIEKTKKKIFEEPGISSIYKSLQFGDFLLDEFTKNYCNSISKENNIDKIIDKVYPISQYYGGIRAKQNICLWDKFVKPSTKYINFSFYKDYKVLEKIENQTIPKVFKQLFSNENIENISLESQETLKQLKNYIYSLENWTKKEIKVDDIRKIEMKRIFVKNLKKTIKFDLEFTVILQGLDNEKNRKMLKNSFGSSFEFINENGKWIVSNFSYSPFN